MACTAEEIAEKKRQAQERLKQKKESIQATEIRTNASNTTSPGTSSKAAHTFYGHTNNEKTKMLNNYENKMKQQQSMSSHINRISSQPYPRRDGTPSNKYQKVETTKNSMVTCACSMISSNRFQVIQKGYNAKLIEVFKSISTRSYDPNTKIWSFELSAYNEVQQKVTALSPHVVIGQLPQFVLKLLKEEKHELDFLCLQGVEKKISSILLDFQKFGVAFGIHHSGRCMIADDMGLGKTYQAIAIADFYRDDWPLLIVTTASARAAWERHIKTLLPSVPSDSIKVLVTTNDYAVDCKVLITSYTLMDKNVELLLKKSFGCIILDESHMIKNFKTKSAQSSKRLCEKAKRVILLTGTPALSRPAELYAQLELIDKNFFGSFKQYALRYCDAKETHFGLDSSGSSNLTELNVVLQRKFMIRRTKESVEFEMGSKSRETVLLDSGKVWNSHDDSMRETIENCKEFSADVNKLKGDQRKEVLLRLYAETAKLKSKAVCAYVKDLVKEKLKFIIFAHHKVMMDSIAQCLNELNVNFIRIDGSTKNELRNAYIDRFQEKKSCQVAVLSLKACNAAITLTAAALVIFAELDWNPSTLAQCESRAHRIGQKEPVTCRYLLANGTADDYMWSMVTQKQDVLNKAGIFSEDLTDATHSTVSILNASPSRTIDSYFSHQNDTNQTKNNNNQCGSKSLGNHDYQHMLDDDDVDDAMLGLDF